MRINLNIIILTLSFALLLINEGKIYAGQKDTVSLKMLFMGDIMQHDGQIKAAYDPTKGTYQYDDCFRYVAPIIKSADIAIANLEVTLAGPPYKGYPQFSAPDALAQSVKNAGIDFLVTANNHSLDRGKKGLERTLDVLDGLDIPHTGTFTDSLSRTQTYPYLYQKGDFEVVILNYTYGTNGIKITPPNIINYIDHQTIINDLAKAKSLKPDIILVFMHWGQEYKSLPNQQQKGLANLCFDHGANLVIGSHPHVVQPIVFNKDKEGKNRMVTYSLGNYVSNQRSRYKDGGLMVEATFKKSLSSDSTWLDDSRHHLTWVYRTSSPQQFHILPASLFEHDTTLLTTQLERDKMALFLADSRELFHNHNVGIREQRTFPQIDYLEFIKGYGGHPLAVSHKAHTTPHSLAGTTTPPESKISPEIASSSHSILPAAQYKIQIIATSRSVHPGGLPEKYQDMVSSESAKNGIQRYFIGDFDSRVRAQQALNDIKANTKYKDAFLVQIDTDK